VKSTVITSDEGVAVPPVTIGYDPASGDVATTTMGGATITREYDRLGRLAAYTDADGGRTVNEFDRFGKPAEVRTRPVRRPTPTTGPRTPAGAAGQ
jgi:YD repeat-containing protein